MKNCISIGKTGDSLGCCSENFKTILNDHKKAYINWKLSPTSNDTEFKKTSNKLNINVNNYMQKIKVNLEEIFNKNQKTLDDRKKVLKTIKNKLKIIETLYKGENDVEKASGPLQNDLSKEILHDYIYSTFLFCGIIFSSSFLIKNFYN
jgi:hypothetical protein|uniref:Uncharacterized protein n=1 Tax=viral metagenome TaxID=1070528 RepID=A0A6C0BZ74_9ZZZZ